METPRPVCEEFRLSPGGAPFVAGAEQELLLMRAVAVRTLSCQVVPGTCAMILPGITITVQSIIILVYYYPLSIISYGSLLSTVAHPFSLP